jgi:hypothetical protein
VSIDAAVAFEPLEMARGEVLPLLEDLADRLGREGQVQGREFFRRVEKQLRAASVDDDLAPPLLALSPTAFAIDTTSFSPASLRLVDRVLERAHALALWLAEPEPPLD